MADIPFEIVGFDLDGTLVDSSADLAAATNFALQWAGLPTHDVEEVKRFVGKGTRIMLERALRASGDYSEERLASLRPVFTEFYERNLAVHTRPYPGVPQVLDVLRGRGVRLGLCTNKNRQFTLPLLEQLGLLDRFDAIVCGDTLPVMKPDPAPVAEMVAQAGGGRTAFLGDTSHDIDAARGAGVTSIAVRFGFVDAADELGADAILGSYGELVGLLESLAG